VKESIMPIKTTLVRTRPSVEVPWYLHPRDKNDYIQTTYIATGDLDKTITTSEDGLSQTVESIWANKRVYTQAMKDETFNIDNDIRQAYNEASGIVETTTVETSTKKFK